MKYILFSCVIFLLSFMHPFYLGVVEMKYDIRQKSMQCSVKLFTNDLEDALRKIHKAPVDLINVSDTASLQKILNAYLASRLTLKVNGKIKTYQFIGFEKEEEAIWMYLEYLNCEQPVKVEIENTLLYDYLSGQTNIVQVEVKDSKKSHKALNPNKDFILYFP